MCLQGILNGHQPRVERLELEQDGDNDYEAELQNLGAESDTTHNTPLDTATTANSELLREARMLSRAHHGSPNIMTPLGEQVTVCLPLYTCVLCSVRPICLPLYVCVIWSQLCCVIV